MARIYKPLEDDQCIAIYRANKGLDGKPVQSQKKLASEYSVAAGRIGVSIHRGAELSSVDGVKSAVKPSAGAKATSKVTDSGVSGLTPDQVAEIQRLHNEEGVNQSKISRDLDIPRHKVRKALTVEVVEHDNDVKSAGTDHIVEVWKQSIGSTFTYSLPTKEDADPARYTLIGTVYTEKPEAGESVLTGVVMVETAKQLECIVESMDHSFEVTCEDLVGEHVKLYPHGTDFNFADPFVALDRALRSHGDNQRLVMRDGTTIKVDPSVDVNSKELVMRTSEFMDDSGHMHIFTDIDTVKTNNLYDGNAHDGFTSADVGINRIDHTQEKILTNVGADAPQCMVLPDQIMVVVDGEPKSLPKDHANFAALAKAIKDQEWETVYRLIDIQKAINQYSNGLLVIDKGRIVFDGEAITHDGFCQRMMQMLQTGEEANIDRLAAFLDKVMDNPSNNIVNRIFDFMKFADVEIADDGDIIAYKGVRGDYRDGHSGKISNAPGNVVTMRRNRVNEKQEQTCSYGLHVCSLSYLPQMSCFGGSSNKIVRVKLSPTDIVSIPTDYKDAKIRCCRYEVVEDVTSDYRSGKLKIDMEGMFSLKQ
ncbi:RIIB lysis inhibitor [Vibrio phage K469]